MSEPTPAESDKRQRIIDDLEGQVTHAWAEHNRTYELMTGFRTQLDEARAAIKLSEVTEAMEGK